MRRRLNEIRNSNTLEECGFAFIPEAKKLGKLVENLSRKYRHWFTVLDNGRLVLKDSRLSRLALGLEMNVFFQNPKKSI